MEEKPLSTGEPTTGSLPDKTDSSLGEGDLTAPPNQEKFASPRKLHGVSWILVVVSTLSSIFLYALDNTIVANIIPAIVESLDHVEQLAWLSVGFMIGGLCMALPLGRLYGIHDAKWLYIISFVAFMAGSALCGAAPTMNAMIIGRVIAGAGGNGMYVGVITLISVNTTEQERPTYLGLIGLTYGIGTVVGPIVGGAFAESPATWRWGFYINLVVGAVLAPIYLLLLPSFKPQPNTKVLARFLQFDYTGMVLQAGFFVTGSMAINFGGTLYAWNSGTTIALFVITVVLLILFGLQQTFTWFTGADSRMFPVHLLKMKEPVLLFICMAANNAGSFVIMYFVPLYFQFARGIGSLNSGVRLLAFIITATAAILINGAIMSKFGYYQPWYIGGSILVLIGGVLLSRIDIDTPDARIYGFEVLLGIGVGAYLQAGYAVIQGLLEPVHRAYAISFMLVGQLLGISLGLSISGATFVNIALSGLQTIFPDAPRVELEAVLSGASGSFFQTLSTELQERSLDVIMSTLQKVFILIYVAGAVSLIAAAFLSRQKLNLDPAAGGA